jgi:hypothetical protein
MWINNKTIEWLDSMDLQDKKFVSCQQSFSHSLDYISVQKWILVAWLHRLTYDNHLVAGFS